MKNPRTIIFRALLSAAIICIGVFAGFAQSLVFNTPSIDSQEVETVYLEGDFYAHFDKYRKCGFQSVSPRVAYGVTTNLEIGVNVAYTRQEDESMWEYQPNIKWKAYENEDKDVAVAAGAILFVPLNKAAGTRATAMFYANASKTFEAVKGLRLTAGMYRMVGADSDFGTKTGLTVGIEQPVAKKFNFLADWSTGNNRFGYSTAGFSYDVTDTQIFGTGYSFGNSGRANNYFTAYYGLTF